MKTKTKAKEVVAIERRAAASLRARVVFDIAAALRGYVEDEAANVSPFG